ncbi:hypothetical protein BDP27DRAFT_1374220 [Rhodocollybia butyracea]|uniref:ELP1 first N-terminal beta-propeller domain-containing protein n=1 Tax=Rhodocollybia butyracea TaxID=206335 RepID=A0A9P5P899_9AGAR|nr:hypothetical protein BDP27DRAFT_1374220 [Rhodocollybia butyracea]
MSIKGATCSIVDPDFRVNIGTTAIDTHKDRLYNASEHFSEDSDKVTIHLYRTTIGEIKKVPRSELLTTYSTTAVGSAPQLVLLKVIQNAQKLVVITKNGDIISVSLDDDLTPEVEAKYKIKDGLLAASWNQDKGYFVLVTGLNTLMLMAVTFDTLCEALPKDPTVSEMNMDKGRRTSSTITSVPPDTVEDTDEEIENIQSSTTLLASTNGDGTDQGGTVIFCRGGTIRGATVTGTFKTIPQSSTVNMPHCIPPPKSPAIESGGVRGPISPSITVPPGSKVTGPPGSTQTRLSPGSKPTPVPRDGVTIKQGDRIRFSAGCFVHFSRHKTSAPSIIRVPVGSTVTDKNNKDVPIFP